MIRPRSFGSSFGWLLPPTLRRDNVHASITVDVADAETMLCGDVVALLRNFMYYPWRRRVGRIRASPTDGVIFYKRRVRFPIAVDVFKNLYFEPNHPQHVVLVPPAQLALRIIREHQRFTRLT